MTASYSRGVQAVRSGIPFDAFDKDVEKKRKKPEITMNLSSLEGFRQGSFSSTELSIRISRPIRWDRFAEEFGSRGVLPPDKTSPGGSGRIQERWRQAAGKGAPGILLQKVPRCSAGSSKVHEGEKALIFQKVWVKRLLLTIEKGLKMIPVWIWRKQKH